MKHLKKSLVILFIILFLVWIVTPTLLPHLSAQEVTTSAYSSDYDPALLSYGLYWFGSAQTAKKFVPGQGNPYFDPTKPTLIFAHGWQPDLSYNCPPDFQYDGCDPE